MLLVAASLIKAQEPVSSNDQPTNRSGPPPADSVVVMPKRLDSWQFGDTQAQKKLTIKNTGPHSVNWHTASEVLQNFVVDPGFEAGTPNDFWEEESLNYDTPICNVHDKACNSSLPPHLESYQGEFWAWFGGVTGVYEQASLSQSVIIPTSATTLSWQLKLPFCDSDRDYLKILIDDMEVYSITGYSGNGLCNVQQEYTYFERDISQFADDQPHTLMFLSETFSENGHHTSFFVDDVKIEGFSPSGSCLNPAQIPWLDVSPSEGSLGPGGQTEVMVTFDSMGLTLLTPYSGTLCIDHDGPSRSMVQVPISMTVMAPSLAFTKTVGLVGSQCPGSNEITVTSGSEVTYCYQVRNTGNISFAKGGLSDTDSQLGLIHEITSTFALNPNDVLSAQRTVDVMQTKVTTATWTGIGADPAINVQASDAVVVTMSDASLTIDQTVTPDLDVPYRGEVTYSIVLRNNSAVDVADVTLTDVLPGKVDFSRWVSQPSGADVNAKTITWNGTVSAGTSETFTFVVVHNGNYDDYVQNTAKFTSPNINGSEKTAFRVEVAPIEEMSVYLPFVIK